MLALAWVHFYSVSYACVRCDLENNLIAFLSMCVLLALLILCRNIATCVVCFAVDNGQAVESVDYPSQGCEIIFIVH